MYKYIRIYAYADKVRKNLLYCGTEYGMYISYDDGVNWKPFQLNLPMVPITDLTIKENDLIVATQGRAFWVLDDLTPVQQKDNSILDKNLFAFGQFKLPFFADLPFGRQKERCVLSH